jgi:hypothetical protein
MACSGRLYLFDLGDDSNTRLFDTNVAAPTHIAISVDGNLVAVAGKHEGLEVWNVVTGKRILEAKEMRAPIFFIQVKKLFLASLPAEQDPIGGIRFWPVLE